MFRGDHREADMGKMALVPNNTLHLDTFPVKNSISKI